MGIGSQASTASPIGKHCVPRVQCISIVFAATSVESAKQFHFIATYVRTLVDRFWNPVRLRSGGSFR